MKARNQPWCPRREGEPGAALVLALLVLAILTVVGIALVLVTGTESRISANEWSVNRAFYASDAGIRWGTVEMTDYQDFLARPEFTGSAFGTVLFELPSHRIVYGVLGDVFSGAEDIAVRLQTPSLIGRRFAAGERINVGSGYFYYSYEIRSASSDQAFGRYAKTLVAQVDVGPLPETAGSR
jgi:type IV pilus assembly PilX-like protein